MSLDESMLPACPTPIFTHSVAAIKLTLLRYNFTGEAARAYLHINNFLPDKRNCVIEGGNNHHQISKRSAGDVVL